MPRGPKGEKRPGDSVGAAVKVAKIATGEMEEELPDTGKRNGGLSGGASRSNALSSEERTNIAREAARARWS